MLDIAEVVNAAMNDMETGWTMGSFGAIAEFHHVAGDPPLQDQSGLFQISSRGGVKISSLQGVRPVAYETLSASSHRWSHGVSLCLKADAARMGQRDCLTELGPDPDALRNEDKGSVLFDLGLNQPQVDFCIRTSDVSLQSILRQAEGRSLFEDENPAMHSILAAHPHRIALTVLGRVEVFQKIGGPETGGGSPEGPHTHVLPKLLKTGRTHSANTPIPEGWIPCASFHPENPVLDRLGRDKDYSHRAFTEFQSLLEVWGVEDYIQEKHAAWDALASGLAATKHPDPQNRLGRVGLRNAIRQWRRQSGDEPIVVSWAEEFDR
ncbi:MAG: hypothetical protein AAF402_10300 [Pseudomonadota bacterium]